jgi:hypothetical protein
MVAWACALVAAAGLVAGEPPVRRALKEVPVDALTMEGQGSATPTDGFNLVWYIPPEFWRVAMLQDKMLTPAGVDEMCGVLDPYFIVGVVRADVSVTGAFRFHDEKRVRDRLTVEYVRDGKTRTLAPVKNLEGDVGALLEQMKPVLGAAMGSMGESLHFYVFSNREGAQEIVSPYAAGTLRVKMGRISKEAGGAVEIKMPLDSLYEPRKCSGCGNAQHITWSFCPWDGKKLGE